MKRILFLISLFLFIPFSVDAIETTEKFYMDVTINEDGSIDVIELSLLNGDYNGRLRNIKYKSDYNHSNNSIFEGNSIYNGSEIINIKVSDVDKNNITFETMFSANNYYSLVNYANNGDYKKYTINNYNGKVDLKIFMPSSFKKASVIHYTINDVVVLHNDYAEIYFNIFDNSYEENVKDFVARIHLPGDDNNKRVWAHGPLNGNVDSENSNTVILTSNFIGAYNPVDYRILFDKSLVNITNPNKISNMDSLDEILRIENERADIANEERESAKRDVFIINMLTYIWVLGIIIYLIYVYINHDKEKKSTFTNQYHREFPNDYRPEMVEYLMKKNITILGFKANIMSLIERKNIKIEETTTKGNNKDYKLILKDRNNLNELDEKIINLLFDIIGSEESVTLKQVSDYSKNYSNALKFSESYNSWVLLAKTNGDMEQLYEKSAKYKVIGILLSLLGILVFTLNNMLGISSFITVITIPLVLISLVYFIAFKKFSDKGIDLYSKWNAFKRFLDDFGRFNEKELPEIILWEKYLVYATALGCAKRVEKAMNIAITKMQNTPNGSVDFNTYYMTHLLLNRSISNAIDNSITKAVASTRASIASSNSSSGSGFGGGFSSGGGFGGGGGGGGRF